MRPAARPAATTDDVLGGLAIRHEAYARKGPVLATQARRLGSRREHRATPWVLDRGDGVLVSTLVCHPLTLALDGRVIPAYGLGSVGTPVAERRKGYAAELCRAACEANEAAGRPVGLLFSDVAPAYYERLGFRSAPFTQFRCERLLELADSGEAASLAPLDPRLEVERLAAAWAAHHRGVLHPHRDAARFLESVEDAADDWFLTTGDPARTYVRLCREPDGWVDIVEWILDDPAREPAVFRAVARLALDAGGANLSGWMKPPESVGAWCTQSESKAHVPMLRGAPPHATARFCRSDHF